MKGITLIFVIASAVLTYADDRCPPEQESNWEIEKLLEHEDCNKFYKCTFGKPVEMSCYGDLYFNLETWQCDWRQNVDCGDRNDPALTTLAPEIEATTTFEPETDPPVPETDSPVIVTTTSEPETTTPEPTTPKPTTAVPTTSVSTTSVPTTSVSTTSVSTTPNPTSPETTTAAPANPEMQFLPNGCPIDPSIHWLLPHEENCNLFYYCVWGEKVLRQCPATLHFNRILQVCDWPWDAGCATSFDKHITGRRLMSDVEVSVKL